jgi:hypothetical protein
MCAVDWHSSWVFLVFLGFVSLSIVSRNIEDAALLPGFYIAPVLVLYASYWRKLRNEIPLDLVIKNFACGFVPVGANPPYKRGQGHSSLSLVCTATTSGLCVTPFALQGAIIVMIVELILTVAFFFLCFSDQIPGTTPPSSHASCRPHLLEMKHASPSPSIRRFLPGHRQRRGNQRNPGPDRRRSHRRRRSPRWRQQQQQPGAASEGTS